MPTPDDTEVIGPTAAHNGKGAVWQRSVKSPKPPIAFRSEISSIYVGDTRYRWFVDLLDGNAVREKVKSEGE